MVKSCFDLLRDQRRTNIRQGGVPGAPAIIPQAVLVHYSQVFRFLIHYTFMEIFRFFWIANTVILNPGSFIYITDKGISLQTP